MKDERLPLESKSPQARFKELGSKLLAVPKDEIDARDKQWQAKRATTKRRKRG
jgi:hypothetical protein